MDISNRIRSMDSLRAIAITTVFIAHTVLAFGAPASLAGLQLGGTGVDLFFVLSGWLLGGVLFRELERDKTINITRFWIRRWYRTLPAYYTVLALTIFQHFLSKDNFHIPWQYFLLLQNYFQPMEIFFISWSLSVEEQFYLVIAPLLLILPRRNSFSNGILIVLIFIPILLRVNGIYESIEQTHVRLDACLIGVLLAKLNYEKNKVFLFISKHSKTLFIISLILYFSLYLERYGILHLPKMDQIVIVLVFAIWVIFANSSSKVESGFYLPGTYYIASRSYSIYLLHPEALAILNRFFSIESFIAYILSATLLTIILAEVLYKTVEIPFIQYRDRKTSS